ncbi:MAG: hypothetical protein B7733_22000 [Myxococcales bacterium FL481]|nr:MAG: hypothetical protein B7733_22000 [Myxococcales bacterium FL481]
MLHSLRKSSTSVFAWLLLGALALVFGLSFGLPSDTLTLGDRPLARVHGERVNRDDFVYQFNAVSSFVRVPQDEKLQQLLGVREEVLDSLVERLVLANVAESLGLRAVERDAELLTADGHVIVLGNTRYWLGDSKFNYERFTQGLLRNLQVSQSRYLEFQRQEILARTVRDLVAASTTVAPSAIREAYDEQANQLSLHYAQFQAADYAKRVDPTPEQLADHVAAHRDALLQEYGKAGARFSKLPARARVRAIRVDLPPAPDDSADAATQAAHRKAVAAARTRLEQAKRRIDNGETFASVARVTTDDAASRDRGGDLGWVNVEGTGSGQEPAVDDAIEALEVGAVSGIVTGEEALYLVALVGRREAGDVPEGEALLELAEDAVRAAQGRLLAQQAAAQALAALRGGKTMADVFDAPGETGSSDLANTPIEELLDAAAKRAEDQPPAETAQPFAPELKTSGLFAKSAPVPGLGSAPKIVQAAWATEGTPEFLDEAFERPDGFVIVGVDERRAGTDEEFAEQRDDIARRLVDRKAAMLTASFTKRRCLDDKEAGKVEVDDAQARSLLTYNLGADEKVAPPKPYAVCDRAGMRGALLRQARFLGG